MYNNKSNSKLYAVLFAAHNENNLFSSNFTFLSIHQLDVNNGFQNKLVTTVSSGDWEDLSYIFMKDPNDFIEFLFGRKLLLIFEELLGNLTKTRCFVSKAANDDSS